MTGFTEEFVERLLRAAEAARANAHAPYSEFSVGAAVDIVSVPPASIVTLPETVSDQSETRNPAVCRF